MIPGVMTMMSRLRMLGSPRNVENMMCSWTVKATRLLELGSGCFPGAVLQHISDVFQDGGKRLRPDDGVSDDVQVTVLAVGTRLPGGLVVDVGGSAERCTRWCEQEHQEGVACSLRDFVNVLLPRRELGVL